jgi:uncharacterized peroxidase-related enzyme
MTSRIATPAVESATGKTAEVFAQIKKAAGMVPNTYAAIGALNVDALQAVLQADAVVNASSLSKQDKEVIKLLASVVTGCDYCVAAHSLIGKMAGLSQETLHQIRHNEATGDAKRDALIRFVRILKETSGTISADEFAAIKAAGYTDVQLVEISLALTVISFTNLFNRINDTTVDFPAVS